MKPFADIDLSFYTYDLPEDRIAAFPAANREDSRLLVARKNSLQHDTFSHLASYIDAGKQVVMNNSKVIPARLIFIRPTGSKIELFCLSPVSPSAYDLSLGSLNDCTWECMVGNLKKFAGPVIEKEVITDNGTIVFRAEKLQQKGNLVTIRFSWNGHGLSFGQILQHAGKTPLPPYIKREAVEMDKERYQTVYSRLEGSVAAPTAGLHFTEHVMNELKQKGIGFHELTLHVGAGTFQPVKSKSIFDHEMHTELIQVDKEFIDFMAGLQNPVVAVGTTSVRTLESLYWIGVKLVMQKEMAGTLPGLDQWECYSLPSDVSLNQAFSAIGSWMESNHAAVFLATTRLIIIPGYVFKTVDRLITNFHQPGSTLLLLIAAFTGNRWKEIYRYALANDFRFLSYGDSSLLELQS